MFSQVETALSRSRGGLGIGLSLTQRLVHMHGGTVEARSEGLGRASEFEVRLPLAPAASSEPDVAAVGDPHAHVEGGGLRILIADDNEDAAATMAVLLDIGTPKINGYEACRQIRGLPGGAAMTVIAVTGSAGARGPAGRRDGERRCPRSGRQGLNGAASLRFRSAQTGLSGSRQRQPRKRFTIAPLFWKKT